MDISYLRSFKILDIAAFDFVLSYAFLAVIIQLTKRQHLAVYYYSILPLSVLIHILFNQETTLVKLLMTRELNIWKIIFSINLLLFIIELKKQN